MASVEFYKNRATLLVDYFKRHADEYPVIRTLAERWLCLIDSPTAKEGKQLLQEVALHKDEGSAAVELGLSIAAWVTNIECGF